MPQTHTPSLLVILALLIFSSLADDPTTIGLGKILQVSTQPA